jgi:hypothetical protein
MNRGRKASYVRNIDGLVFSSFALNLTVVANNLILFENCKATSRQRCGAEIKLPSGAEIENCGSGSFLFTIDVLLPENLRAHLQLSV